jgi:hypothetical protein
LFTHTTRPNVSVQCVFQERFDLRLRPRLTNAASDQLDSLISCLQGINLGDGTDTRLLKLNGKPYTARDAYAALDTSGDPTDPHGRRIWGTRLPNKVKVFAWLFFKDRLSTRVNLHAKHVVDNDQCQRCAGSVEDRHHVFFRCPSSLQLWSVTALSHVAVLSDDDIWDAIIPQGLDASVWHFVLLTILWRLWDSRNGEVFRNDVSHHRAVLSRVCDDLVTWRKRLAPELVNSLDGWRIFLLNCNSTAVTHSRQLV